MDDLQYIELVLNGDSNAFNALVDRYKSRIYTFILRMMGNPEDAEETAHDAFVKAYTSLYSFRNQSKFSTWLFKIAYNESISRIRKKNRAPELISLDDPVLKYLETEETENYLNELEEKEQVKLIMNAVNRLPDDEQLMINLYYLQEFSIKEITGITGFSEANVKVKLFRARNHLWEKLNRVVKPKSIRVHEPK
jgi:RNA polymerase sigma-70 factor (ECF subfamily)